MLRALLSRSPRKGKDGDPYVAFLADLDEPLEMLPSTVMETPLASFRLRTLIPSRQLARSVRIWVLPLKHLQTDPMLTRYGEPVAVVLTKLPSSFLAHNQADVTALLGWIDRWRGAGRRLIADLSDNYASTGHPRLEAFQKKVLREAELVVPCNALRAELAPDAANEVTVIEDPYERQSAGTVRVQLSDPLKLCWFGQFSGPTRESVARELLELLAHMKDRRTVLTLVAGARQLPALKDFALRAATANPGATVRFTQWSVASTWAAIEDSDLVLLPQDSASAWGRVKSHNRMVETIRCGRLALASPIPAYLELADYGCVRPSLSEAFDWTLSHTDEAGARVRAGQVYIENRFSPGAIAEKWGRLLGVA